MSGYLVSPSEPLLIKALGTVSHVPELFGMDVLWHEPEVGLIGVQRKETNDLVSSIMNGMLAKELAKGKDRMEMTVLVVEGRARWTIEGQLLHSFVRFSRAQYRGFLRSCQLRGVIVEYSDDTADTVALVESLKKWAEKNRHTSLDTRPKPHGTPANWGQVTNAEWASHLLQAIPTIGPVQADAIYDHFGGQVPVGLTVTREELLEVRGLGPKRVDKIITAFNGKAGRS